MSPRFRRSVVGAALVAVAAGVAVALVASPASAGSPKVFPPPPGGIVSCLQQGKTYMDQQTAYSPVCNSFQTAFWGYYPYYGSNCNLDGYDAQVWTTTYKKRWDTWYCEDGAWHWSSAWGSNEVRFSQMNIADVNTNWEIVQYKK